MGGVEFRGNVVPGCLTKCEVGRCEGAAKMDRLSLKSWRLRLRLRLVTCDDLAVRGPPDPARRLTKGLREQRFALIQGDLRSNPRRGRETRAEAI